MGFSAKSFKHRLDQLKNFFGRFFRILHDNMKTTIINKINDFNDLVRNSHLKSSFLYRNDINPLGGKSCTRL